MKLNNNDIGKWFIDENGNIFKLNDITVFEGIEQATFYVPSGSISWFCYQKDFIENIIAARVSFKP